MSKIGEHPGNPDILFILSINVDSPYIDRLIGNPAATMSAKFPPPAIQCDQQFHT